MYSITFQQVASFLAVAQYMNLTKAAEALYISQPALSKTLRRFEEGIGLRLFTRSNHGVALTREGEYLRSTLEPLFNNMNKTIKTAQSFAGSQDKSLRIVEPSSFDAAEDYDVPKRIIRQYEDKYPDVVLIESLCDFRELRQQLEYGDADIVLAQDFAVSNIQNISVKRVARFNLYIAMSVNHPLARHDRLVPELMGDEVFYIEPHTGDPSDMDNLIRWCGRMGFSPRSIEYAPNFQTLLHTIRQCKGLSICGRYKYIGTDDIKYFAVDGGADSAYIVAAWRSGTLSREARSFIDMLPPERV
jgi:DNA-binding transcriptional LysR family regulator